MDDIKDIIKKYRLKLEGEDYSREYSLFKEEILAREESLYEKLCRQFSFLNIVKSSEEEKLNNAISILHLNVTSSQVSNFAFFVLLSFVVLAFSIISVFYFFFGVFNFLLPILLLLIGLIFFVVLNKYPLRLLNRYRLKASNQRVI